MPFSFTDAMLRVSLMISEKLPNAPGLALAFAYCWASGQQFPAFVASALTSDLVVNGVEDLCRLVSGGASEDEALEQARALASAENARGIEELAAVIISLGDDLAKLPDQFRHDLLDRVAKQQRELHEQWGRRIMDVVGAPPFDIHCTINGLLTAVAEVRSHGPAHVVDRPESSAIVKAFQGSGIRQVLLRGRALSGKTFLSYKVAQRWIVAGGQVAWMRAVAGESIGRYIAAIRAGATIATNLPLIVWEPSDDEPLKQEVFEQLQRYDGPVLIAVRVGGSQKHGENHDRVLKTLIKKHGFSTGTIAEGYLSPNAERVSLFLGPIDRPSAVVSAMVRAGGHLMTLTEDGLAALTVLMMAGKQGQRTTLLGLGQACLKALRKETRVDRQAVEALLGPDHSLLSNKDLDEEEDVIDIIFNQTVDADEKDFLVALRLYKQWTFTKGMNEEVLTATIQACCDAGRGLRDCRTELTSRGVLTYAPPWYWVWHDLQLDVATKLSDDLTEEKLLNGSIDHLVLSIKCVASDQRKKALAKAGGAFAAELHQSGHWNHALRLHTATMDLQRDLATAFGAGKEEAEALAMTCNNLGILLKNMGQRPEALELYQEALQLYRDLARDQPKAYNPYVAITYNNLGTLLADMGQRPEALQLYQEALTIRRDLARDQPKAYNPYVALTCNNLGNLLAEMGQRPEALQLYQEALTIRRDLARDQPKAYNPDVATTCNNLGLLLAEMGQRPEALQLYQEALQLYRDLARDQPKAYNPYVAITYNNLGTLLADMGQRPEALELFQEALQLYRDLARDQPKAYNPYVAITCNNLGNLLADMGQRQEALELYQEALTIRRDLSRDQPKAYNPDVAGTCNNLGILLKNMGQRPEALELYQEALQLYRDLARDQPKAYNPYVAITYNNLGTLLADMGQRPEALELFQEALQLYRDLARDQPKAYNPDVAMTCNNLGNLLADMGQRQEALELYQEALTIRRDLSRDQPKAYNPDVAGTCNNLGILLKNMGQRPEALQLYQEALQLYRDLARDQPKAYNPYVAITYNNLGLLLAEMGQRQEAANLLIDALVLRYGLFLEMPQVYGERVSITLKVIHRLVTDQEFDESKAWLERTWAGLLQQFQLAILHLCPTLADLFHEAGFADLALAPRLLLARALEKMGHPETAQAASAVQDLKADLGEEFEPLCQKLEQEFAPLLAELSEKPE